MIKIEFREPTTPKWRRWRARCDAEQIRHNLAIQAGSRVKAKQNLYKGQKESVYLYKDGPFYGKCAYCECNIYQNQHGDVEHFRPKGAIKDINGDPIQIPINGILKDHPGYYWLAYSWTNLLPACQLCNQPSTQRSQGRLIGKRDYFPLSPSNNFRATNPGEEALEAPLLINPAWEDPGEHLTLDASGVYSHKTDRGDECIRTFGLNDRDLPNERAKTYQDVINFLGALSQQLRIDPNGSQTIEMLRRLRRIKDGAETYSASGRLAIRARRASLINELNLL